MKKTLILSSLLVLFTTTAFADPKGEEYARKSFDLKKSTDSYSLATMVLIDKAGKKRNRKLEMYSMEGAKGRNTFIVFKEPADVSGTKFLTLGNKAGDDDQRLYLPALKKVRRIAASGKEGKFMGSDITYYDMEERNFEDSTYKYLKDETVAGKDCAVVEMTSTDAASPYSKSIAWIAKDNYYAYKRELYDRKSQKLAKIIFAQEVKEIGGVLINTKMVVDNVKDGTKTLLISENDTINSGLKASLFTVENLEK